MNNVLNVSAYRFVPVADAPALCERLRALARALGLKGTVLLAPEGINLFLAGPEGPVRTFLRDLRTDARFTDLEARETWSSAVPFRRLVVKVKREIIRIDQPAIQPARSRAPVVPAATLKAWLDQGHGPGGRPLLLLDTRNAFEVDYGTFDGAVDFRLARFSEFPRALERHRGQLEDKAVVSFCTGGIRCEKAALLMQQAGLPTVWQLEGGILKYFEQAGGAHFRGRCFVFDKREAVHAGEVTSTRNG